MRVISGAAVLAVILGVVELAEVWTGWKSGITEQVILTVLGVVTPLAAWWAGREIITSAQQ